MVTKAPWGNHILKRNEVSLLIPASPSLANSELQLVWEAAHLCLVINSSFA